MKHTVLLCLAFMLVFASCQKVDFSSDEDDTKVDKPADGAKDSVNVMSVAQAIYSYTENAASDTLVKVDGYIVGVVEGTSIGKAVFTGVTDRVSNILLADSPEETDVANCMPVQLKDGTEMRSALNLSENPDVYKRKVRVLANLTTYFLVAGLTGSFDYAFLDSVPDDGDEEPDPVIPKDTVGNPQIDHNGQYIQGGRSTRIAP